MRPQKTVKEWFMFNDIKFGTSLLGKEPEQQVKLICDKYGFNESDIDSEETLLSLLNGYTEK